MIFEFPPEKAEKLFEESPTPGDTVVIKGEKHLITAVDIVNRSKVVIQTDRYREVMYYEDLKDESIDWDELSQGFLQNENETDFLNQGRLAYNE
jgi:hypothetical protein